MFLEIMRFRGSTHCFVHVVTLIFPVKLVGNGYIVQTVFGLVISSVDFDGKVAYFAAEKQKIH